MNISSFARALSVCGLLLITASGTGCFPEDLLGIGGDSGPTQYTPDYNLPPPAHSAAEPCQDPDPTHLCVAVNYVAYENSSQPIVTQEQAAQNIGGVNSIWTQCHVQFYLENYEAVNPSASGLPFQPTSSDDLPAARNAYQESNRLTVISTGQWTGDLGSQPANAWTELPPVGPFGVVLEASVATYYNLIAHELGHYLNLVHVADQYDVMNPTVYSNSLNLTDDQCSMAHATAISFWGAALR